MLGQDEVEQDGGNGRQTHASQGEVTDLHLQRADTHGQGHGHDGDVARHTQVHLGLHQGLETDGGDGSEQQQHDTAHHRHGDGGEQGVELAEEGQNDGEHGGPGHGDRVEVAGDHHGAGHFRVGGDGRSTDKAGEADPDAVTGQGAVQTRILGIVLPGHTADGQHATDMFDAGGDGHRQHEQRSSPVDLGSFEVGQRQPGGIGHAIEAHLAHQHGRDIAGNHTAQDGDQLDPALAEHGGNQSHRQRDARQGQRRGGRHYLFTTGTAHRHVAGNLGDGEANHHDHRANHHWRQQFVHKPHAASPDDGSQDEIHETGGKQAEHGGWQTPGLGGIDDGSDKGETGTEEDRNLTAGAELEQQGSHTGAKQGHGGVKSGEQGHQNHGTEGDKQDLQPGDALLD